MVGSGCGKAERFGGHQQGGLGAPGEGLHPPVLVDLLHPFELDLLIIPVYQSSNCGDSKLSFSSICLRKNAVQFPAKYAAGSVTKARKFRLLESQMCSYIAKNKIWVGEKC